MLRIDTIETTSAITLELHGRLIGPWVPLLETLWKSNEGCPSGRAVVVDLTDVTAIDGAACYLLRLMEAKNVRLSGGGIGIRALLGLDLEDWLQAERELTTDKSKTASANEGAKENI